MVLFSEFLRIPSPLKPPDIFKDESHKFFSVHDVCPFHRLMTLLKANPMPEKNPFIFKV
jgi:hypothetical protein